MRVLGVDCGTERTGYGVIESDGKRHSLVTFGVIRTKPKDPLATRLHQIGIGLRAVILENTPQEAAVEAVFHAANVRSALTLAHTRGVVLYAIADAGIPLGEYSPMEVKSSVVGYGRADKGQVQFMVQSILGLPEMIESEDAADAVAVAICHAAHSAYRARMEALR